MQQQVILIFGAVFGMLSVVFGAFGAHALKKIATNEQLKSFETGVKYQMYHAIVLLIIGFNMPSPNSIMIWCFVIGTLLFSFSIYSLVILSLKNKKLRFLGPITPIGGLLLIMAWALLLFSFF